MELSPGLVITVAVVAIAAFVLLRGRRHEAAAPAELQPPAAPSRATAAREERENQPLVEWLLERAREQTGIAVADDALARQRIVEAAAKAMDELRTVGSTSISLPFLTADRSGPKHFVVEFKRRPDGAFELD